MIGRTRDEWTDGRLGRERAESQPTRKQNGRRPDRGQTAVDFAIAMGLFLVVVVIVMTFLPQMIDPFYESPSEDPLVADRVANQLVDYQLSGGETNVLDTTCTVYFFNATPDPTCSSWTSGDDSIHDRVGVDKPPEINVTIQESSDGFNSEPLCGYLDEPAVSDPDCTGDEHQLAIGEEPPEDRGSISEARRIVQLDDHDNVVVIVRVWR